MFLRNILVKPEDKLGFCVLSCVFSVIIIGIIAFNKYDIE